MKTHTFLVQFVMFFSLAGGIAQAEQTIKARYPEGPIWHNGRLYFAEMDRDRVTVWDGNDRYVLWKQDGCGPTAIANFNDKEFLLLCHRGGYLVRISEEGETLSTISRDREGKRILTPNDITPDGRGGAFFSNSGLFDINAEKTGAVLHIDRHGLITRLVTGLKYANGVFFDIRAGVLYVSEHLDRRLLRYKLDDNSKIVSSEVFADLSSLGLEYDYIKAGPDGIEIDKEGNVWICEYGEGRVHVFDQSRNYFGVINLPQKFLTNVAIGPDDRIVFTGAFRNNVKPRIGSVVTLDRKEALSKLGSGE